MKPEIRNPKSERRPKSETRGSPAIVRRLPVRASAFGFLPGFGLRISALLLGCLSLTAAVVKIDLPPETASFKPGPGAELANGQCLICHSVDYVTMQPPMPRAFWAAGVKKMREKYGAPLPDEQVEPMVNYLVTNYGIDTNKTSSATASVGVQAPASPGSADIKNPEALAAKYFCLTCHSVDAKLVGPPYKEVAAKYQKDSEAFGKISEQIHKGGSGKWGPILMPPFPMIPDAETKALTEWILTRK